MVHRLARAPLIQATTLPFSISININKCPTFRRRPAGLKPHHIRPHLYLRLQALRRQQPI